MLRVRVMENQIFPLRLSEGRRWIGPAPIIDRF
jgi:hypothetical protein